MFVSHHKRRPIAFPQPGSHLGGRALELTQRPIRSANTLKGNHP